MNTPIPIRLLFVLSAKKTKAKEPLAYPIKTAVAGSKVRDDVVVLYDVDSVDLHQLRVTTRKSAVIITTARCKHEIHASPNPSKRITRKGGGAEGEEASIEE